jgi:hypothetical protein
MSGLEMAALLSHHRTQVVAGDHSLFVAERMDQLNHVAN